MYDNENKKHFWGHICIKDIESFIEYFKDKKDPSYNYDIIPSKIVKNFTNIKSLLIKAGWKWNQ